MGLGVENEAPRLEMELRKGRPFLVTKKGVKSLEKQGDTDVLSETCHPLLLLWSLEYNMNILGTSTRHQELDLKCPNNCLSKTMCPLPMYLRRDDLCQRTHASTYGIYA